MKWFILVIALSIFLELSLAKSNDKTYPKKVKNKKPTKNPKTILDEFSTVSEDDKEFIKELDKQFKMYGDMIKIKVERDNSTVKNPKRTIEGELGYGNQNAFQQPRFQFGPAKFQIYPYSQQGIPPLPFSFNGNGFGFGQSAVQIQPSRAYEIKQTPVGYQTFAPNNSPFRPLFTTKPPAAAQSYSPAPFPTAAYPTTKFPNTPPFISSPAPYTTTPSPFGTTLNPLFTTQPPFLASPIQTQGFANFQTPFQPAGLPIQQQYSEPVIVLKIPGPAKYASHLQALLQRYLEIRAAQYIKAFEDHEARVAQQQALFRSQSQQPYQQAQQPSLHPLIQSTEYYKPATNYMVPAPGPTTSLPPQEHASLLQQQNLQQQNFQQQNFEQQNLEQQTVAIAPPIRRPQTYATSQIQQPKQLAIQIENADGSGYSFPKIQQQQQFIVQQVPVVPDPVQQSYRQPTAIFESKPAVPATQSPESVQTPADYVAQKPEQPESLGMQYNQQSYSSPYGNKPYPEVDEQYQQQQQYESANAQSQSEYGPTKAPEQVASLQTAEKPSEFSLNNILRKQNFQSFAAFNRQQQQATTGGEQEADDQPEIPEARHQPTYSNEPVPENVQRDEDQQLFSYDQAPQTQENQQPVQRPHKVYGPPAVDPAADTEAALPTLENNPRPTHTRIRFNENNNGQDHSSVYPLPPLPSSIPKFDYERQQQQQQQQGYETVENEYGTQEQVANIAEQQRSRDYNRYNSQSVLETDFQGDAPYTQSQFRKLNELINKLKQRSSPLQVRPLQTDSTANRDQ